MKITTFFLLITVMTVSASSFAQKITLNEKKASLEQVLAKIRQQSGFDILYSNDDLARAVPVTVSLKDADLEVALRASLAEQALTFEIEDGTVLIKKLEKSFLEKVKEAWAAIDVSGTVYDENGQPLPGVTVRVKNGNAATVTNSKGGFTLGKVDPEATLLFTFIGYANKELKASEDLSRVSLQVSESKLDEIKIVAYGVTTDRTSVGNVSSVKGDEIRQSLTNNPILGLVGRIPGLQITQQSGYSGQAPKITIQGQNSINSGNSPFYVVDGIPFNSQSIAKTNEFVDNTISPLSMINPNDIESISVLKDASATAIYGSRAANGAILITTKKGKAGPTRIEITGQQGLGMLAKKLDLLNTEQYLQIRRSALATDGLTPSADRNSPGYARDLTIWDQKSYTDWQEVLLGNKAYYTDVNPSFTGGSDYVQYFAGFTYHREDNVLPTNLSNKNAGLNVALNGSSANRRFTVGLKLTGLINDNQLPSGDLAETVIQLAPNAPTLYNSDGSLNWAPGPDGRSTWVNPLSYFERRDVNKTTAVRSALQLRYESVKGLVISTNLGYHLMHSNQFYYLPQSARSPDVRGTNGRFAYFSNSKNHNWNVQPQITYSKTVGRGILNMDLGGSIEKTNNDGTGVYGRGYPSDALLSSLAFATEIRPSFISNSQYKRVGIFARVNYNWDSKYIIEVVANRDGSSRFGDENKFENFGSAGVGWLISEENFFKEIFPFISFGKVSASYGTTGNDQIGDYSYYTLYNPIDQRLPYQGGAGLRPNGLSNPYLQWELTKKLNLGGQFNFLGDKIGVNINYFINRSSNQLLGTVLPRLTGFSGITVNLPATVQNTGLELSLNTVNINTPSFNWTTNFNVTIPRNKLTRYDGLEESYDRGKFIVGKSLNLRRLFHAVGVNPQTGIYEYQKRDGSITTNPDFSTDQYIEIDQNPIYYGGLTNHLRYKTFSLDFTLSFRRQQMQNYSLGLRSPGAMFNQTTAVLSAWQKAGDKTDIPLLHADGGASISTWNVPFLDSDATWKSTFWARLSTVNLNWSMPERWTSSLHVKGLSLFARAQNLLTFTNYVGWDPETANLGLPPLKYITLGFQTKF